MTSQAGDDLYAAALGLFQQGQGPQAEQALRGILAKTPRHFDACHLLGILLLQSGRLVEADKVLAQASALRPMHASLLSNRGVLLLELKRPKDALMMFDKALSADKNYGSAQYNRGLALRDLGRMQEALDVFAAIAQAQPNEAEVQMSCGNCLYDLAQYEEALAAFENAIRLAPERIDFVVNRGNAKFKLKRLDDAMADYTYALKHGSKLAGAHQGIGNILNARGELNAAVTSFRQATALNPQLEGAWESLGHALLAMKLDDDALRCFARALDIKPTLATALLGMGDIQRRKSQPDLARASFDKVIAVEPSNTNAWINRAILHVTLNEYDEAVAAFSRALTIDPKLTELGLPKAANCIAAGRMDEAWSSFNIYIEGRAAADMRNRAAFVQFARDLFAVNNVPAVFETDTQVQDTRADLLARLDDLLARLKAMCPLEPDETAILTEIVFQITGFYWAYQQANEKASAARWSLILQVIFNVAPDDSLRAQDSKKPIRIGLASSHLYDHNGANWAYHWLSRLPKGEYEFYVYAFNVIADELTAKFKALGTFRQLPFEAKTYRDTLDIIQADQLDALMLPAIGMTAESRILSQFRLAPVQFTGWGHPVTSAGANMDYYLSSDLMEPANAQDHYLEKLIRLPNLALYLTPGDSPRKDKAPDLKLPKDRVIYGSLQSLFKYLPRYDDVFVQIAKAVPSAYFIFIDGGSAQMTNGLRARLTKAFAAHGLDARDYVRFIPRVTGAQFRHLFTLLDVNLDSLGWSGGNTTVQAIEAACPTVTLEGEFMRGRHSSAMLRRMGMDDAVAVDVEDYIRRAVDLGQNPESRKAMRAQLEAKRALLFNDDALIPALDAFLKQERA